MAIALLEALATDLLEDKNLVSLYLIVQNCSLYYSTFNIRSSDLYSLSVSDEKNFSELHSSTFFSRKAVYEDFISSFNFELLACNVNDCVHK